jgi:hypothetical protein
MPPRKRSAPRESKAKSQCKLHCCAVSDETAARIRASVEKGRGKSMFPDDPAEGMPMFGPQCRCGVPRKPPGAVNDDGLCVVHPDRPPQPWTRGVDR